jgi:hypothetical protein
LTSRRKIIGLKGKGEERELTVEVIVVVTAVVVRKGREVKI